MEPGWHNLVHWMDRNQHNTAEPEDGESPWDVLIQITLPMILILALVIQTQIEVYKNAYRTYRDEVEKTGAGETLAAYEKALVEIQKQQLIVAMEKVKREKEKELYLDRFISSSVSVKSGHIEDRDFLKVCNKTREIFANESARKNAKKRFYKDVLDKYGKNGLSESSKMWKRESDDLPIRDMLGKHITKDNKSYTEKTITGFFDEFEKNTKLLQFGVIKQIISDRLSNPPSNLEPEALEAYHRFQEELKRKKGNPQPHLKEFLKCQIDDIENQLKLNKYIFLEGTWKDIMI